MRMKGKGNSTNLFWYHWKHWDFLLGKSIYEWWPRKQERGSSQCAKVKEKGKLPIDGCGDNDRSSSSSFLEITWERASYFSVSDFQDGCTWLHLLLACLFLPDHSNLLVQVLPSWTSVTQHFLVLTKQYVIPSSLVDHQEMKIEWKEPFLSRAPARGGRCWWCPG